MPRLSSRGAHRADLRHARQPASSWVRSRWASTASVSCWPWRSWSWSASPRPGARGFDPGLVTSAIVVVAIFALVGARLYHVIDEWQIYADDPIRAVLPPYAGLGLYGGIIGAAVGIWVFLRGKSIPLGRARSMSSYRARCSRRVSRAGATSSTRSCTDRRPTCPGASPSTVRTASPSTPARLYPAETHRLPPAVPVRVDPHHHRRRHRTGPRAALQPSLLRDGDLASFWMIWYGGVRLILEFFRDGWNWTILGIPTAMLIGVVLITAGWARCCGAIGGRARQQPGSVAPGPRLSLARVEGVSWTGPRSLWPLRTRKSSRPLPSWSMAKASSPLPLSRPAG